MKTIAELSKKELANLNYEQVDAYIDIELATREIVKPINLNIDYPDFIKKLEVLPEKDVAVYEVDGYTFADLETAQKFSTFVGTLSQVKTSYDYYSGDSIYWAENQEFIVPIVQLKKLYSRAKYIACKEQIKQIVEKKRADEASGEDEVENVINFQAIDGVRDDIKRRVRGAIEFFAKAKSVANDYPKYFSIVNESSKAIETLFTVYNIQDEELRAQIKIEIDALSDVVTN